MPRPRSLLETHPHLIVVVPDGCWIWIGAQSSGYGMVRDGAQARGAHRVEYTRMVGPVSDELDHLCRRRACINPDHLEDVTHSENIRRGLPPIQSKERAAKRTHCPRGHPYSGENLYLTPQGNRQCKTCRRAQFLAWKARQGLAG